MLRFRSDTVSHCIVYISAKFSVIIRYYCCRSIVYVKCYSSMQNEELYITGRLGLMYERIWVYMCKETGDDVVVAIVLQCYLCLSARLRDLRRNGDGTLNLYLLITYSFYCRRQEL
jgi:hypothetical protein